VLSTRFRDRVQKPPRGTQPGTGRLRRASADRGKTVRQAVAGSRRARGADSPTRGGGERAAGEGARGAGGVTGVGII